MNPENLATAQEEATLTKIRNFLNEQKVKLWEEPYYDPKRKAPQEEKLHELAVSVSAEVNLPRPHVFQVACRGGVMRRRRAVRKCLFL